MADTPRTDEEKARDRADCALGPYHVHDITKTWFQVRDAATNQVRAALHDRDRAVQKCAEFNRAHP